MKKTIIIPAVSLFVICLVAAVLLAFTNQATADKIDAMTKEQAKASQSKVLDTAASFDEQQVVVGEETYVYQIGKDAAGQTVGYVFTTAANGYGGQVKVMTAVLPDGTVKQIEILDVNNETPGLGQNAKNDSFFTQFAGKKTGLTVTKNAGDGNQIQAITGATITSKAVAKAVNDALAAFDAVKQQTQTEGGADLG